MNDVIKKALEIEASALESGKASGAHILALRDEFAKAAMAAMLASPNFPPVELVSEPQLAKHAYMIAEAMLSARNA